VKDIRKEGSQPMGRKDSTEGKVKRTLSAAIFALESGTQSCLCSFCKARVAWGKKRLC
jgi:hypothetical protein